MKEILVSHSGFRVPEAKKGSDLMLLEHELYSEYALVS
jgi:hypothetical protein